MREKTKNKRGREKVLEECNRKGENRIGRRKGIRLERRERYGKGRRGISFDVAKRQKKGIRGMRKGRTLCNTWPRREYQNAKTCKKKNKEIEKKVIDDLVIEDGT